MTKSLSDFWRTRRSYDKAIEMKTVLEDLKAFIEMAADEGEFAVTWGKQSQTNPDAKEVTLSYAPVADVSTPFSGEAVDVVAGFAAHEAGHRIRDQRGQSVRLLDVDELPDGMPVNIERAIRNLLEDVYIDHYLYVSKAPVLETYIKRGREWDKTQPKYAIDTDELKMKAQAEELSKLDILKLWAKYELYGFNSADELKDFPDSTLETLLNLAQITDTYCKKKGLVDAVEMYKSIWDEMKGYGDPTGKPSGDGEKSDDSEGSGGDESSDKDQEDDDQQKDSDSQQNKAGGNSDGDDTEDDESDDSKADEEDTDNEEDTDKDISDSSELGADDDEESDDDTEDKDSSGDSDSTNEDELDDPFDKFLPCQDKSHQELPEDLEQSIEAAIMNDREDITQDIIEEFKDEGLFDAMQDQYHSNVIVEKAASMVLPDQDDEVSRSIRQIFNFRKRRKTRYSRGTEEGTISQSRLYRAGLNSQHLYEKRDIKDSLDINICILVDMSSSVISSQEILGQCVSSLALGLSHRRGVKVCALAYNSGGIYLSNKGNDVNIYRLFETGDKEVCFVKADGGTPSAAAIGAVPGLMRRLLGRASDSLLIHITDGFPHDEKLLHAYIEDLVEVLAKKHKIDTYCLAIMGYGAGGAANQDQLLTKAYGDSYEKLNSYTDLPEALRKLLYNLLVTS